MYLNFVNDQVIGKPQQLPNCYECISNFDCLEKNDPEALKDLAKYGLPGHKWLKVLDCSDKIDELIYQKYNYEKFSFSIIENLVHLKYDIINLDKDQLLYKIREERNKIIASTDWTQFADIVLPEYDKYRYLVYRKALRDVPNKYLQSGKIEWPTL